MNHENYPFESKFGEPECNCCGAKIGKQAGKTCTDCQRDQAQGFPLSNNEDLFYQGYSDL
jgi:hypothetical protein